VSDQINDRDFEMLADGFDVIKVLMDSSYQFGTITDGFRAAAITQVEKYDRASAGKMPEAIEHMNRVGDNHRIGAVPELLKEQPNAIFRSHVTFTWQHVQLSSIHQLLGCPKRSRDKRGRLKH
jgi:hypothetical protein